MDSTVSRKAVASSKSRGRPRKNPNDEILDDKRARGRKAQKNYMYRRQAETERLKQRIASLEDSVEGMSNEFIYYGDQVAPYLHMSVLDNLKKSTQRFLQFARTAQSLVNDNEEQDLLSTEHAMHQEMPRRNSTFSQSSPGSPTSLIATAHVLKLFDFGRLQALTDSTARINPSIQPGKFSPRLSYGLLSKPTPSSYMAQSVWTHYLISGPNSFAKLLYTETLNLTIKAITNQINLPDFIPSIFRYRFRHETPSDFIELATGQLDRMSLSDFGPQQKPNPDDKSFILFGPSHPVMTASLRAEIYKDIQGDMIQDPNSLQEWFDPWSTQQYLQKQWGVRFSNPLPTARVANAAVEIDPLVYHTMEGMEPEPWRLEKQHEIDMREAGVVPGTNLVANPSQLNFALSLQPMVVRLIEQAVCFGEGPRFLKENIDGAALEFLSGALV